MKKCLFLFLLILSPFAFAFAEQTVSGVVIDETQEPLIGVSVVVKGTTTGVITDFDGNYRITVPDGGTLVFSYIGMKSQEVKVSASSQVVNVTMVSDTQVIDEVVVTAMGVKTEKKKLNFAVQSVDGDALMDSRSANFVTALQGKVSGLSVTNGGGSPNAGSSVVLRGISSINSTQSNQPLYILDGVAISGGTGDINPADIENITVLKGAAASALYGQDAANGVIMITTKQGEIGKLKASASVGLQMDWATRIPQVQQLYGPGAWGAYKSEAQGGSAAWGPPLDDSVERYDNIRNYFQTGHYEKYDFNVSGGSEKFQTYASASYSNHVGIEPNDYLKKTNLLLKGSYTFGKMLRANVTVNVVNNKSRGSSDDSGIKSLYTWPVYDDVREYMRDDRWPRFRYLSENDKLASPISPLYSRYMDSSESRSTRSIIQGSVVFTPVRNLDITGRVSYDHNASFYDGYTAPRFDRGSTIADMEKFTLTAEDPNYQKEFEKYKQLEAQYNADYYLTPNLNQSDLKRLEDGNDKDLLGEYRNKNSWSKFLTATVLATYKLDLPMNFGMEFLAGAEAKESQGYSMDAVGQIFDSPSVYSMLNTRYKPDPEVSRRKQRKAAAFGEVRFDYNGLANLSATYRADWSSTLRWEYNPYSYWSVTGGVVFSELLGIANNWFSYGKLRGNWAQVGKDTSPYLFDRRYSQYTTLPDGGYGADPSLSTASETLMPEMSSSWEVGADLRFFDSRTRLDVAYYSTAVTNQIVTVRVSPSSGYILQTRNEGDIENKGVEFTLEQDIIRSRDFNWTATLNFGLNRSKVRNLPEGMTEIEGPQYSGNFPTAYLHSSTTSISGKDYERTADGQVIVDERGFPKIISQKSTLIADREPDFLMGLGSTMSYKGWSLSFLFDGRKGGDILNVTAMGLTSSGQHKMLETYRGRQIVWDGVVAQPDGSYVQNTTPVVVDQELITNYYANVGSNFIEDGSYIRLSYVTLAYDFSRFLKDVKWISGLRCSLTGSNLFLLTKYTGSDPQTNADTSANGVGAMGIDNYPIPNTRGFNFTLNATF